MALAVVVPERVVGSSEVNTLIVYEPAAGFVTPGIVNDAGVLLANEQLAPASVMSSIWPMATPVALQPLNPLFKAMVVEPAGSVKPAGNFTNTRSPASSPPPYGGGVLPGADVVKSTVQGWVKSAS